MYIFSENSNLVQSERNTEKQGREMAGFELLSDQGLRLDGRKAGELRRIQCRMGVFGQVSDDWSVYHNYLSLIGQADGSAYLEQGNTKVLAAVYGPHDMSRDTRLRPQHDR